MAHRLHLTKTFTTEVVPMRSLETARQSLRAGSSLSITCSPVKGIEETQRLTEEFLAQGFDPIPHFSSRLVRDRNHTRLLGNWCREAGVAKVLVVGGDGDPKGSYSAAAEFLSDFLGTDHGLEAIGVPAYPDHHAFIPDQQLHQALHQKQALLADAGVTGWCSTQMCFDAEVVEKWIRNERAAGLTLGIHLGLAGVVDKAKLISTGARIGLGQSLNYLRKNRSAIVKMMASTAYDPNDLLLPLSQANLELGVEKLHVFTFNQVAATEAWREVTLGSAPTDPPPAI